MARHDPDFLRDWQRIPRSLWVVKADYIRILLGVVRGGFYFDCDIEPLHALAPLCRRGLDCVLFMEGHQGLSNAAFGVKPNHPFMARTLERIRQNIRQRVLAPPALNSNDVLALTGPPQFNVTAREMKIPLDIADVVHGGEASPREILTVHPQPNPGLPPGSAQPAVPRQPIRGPLVLQLLGPGCERGSRLHCRTALAARLRTTS